jgi:membrane protease subunit HflC
MATRIFAAAHKQDPEFYAFVRSLEAYRKTLSHGTTMVLSPGHVFLRYLAPDLGGSE